MDQNPNFYRNFCLLEFILGEKVSRRCSKIQGGRGSRRYGLCSNISGFSYQGASLRPESFMSHSFSAMFKSNAQNCPLHGRNTIRSPRLVQFPSRYIFLPYSFSLIGVLPYFYSSTYNLVYQALCKHISIVTVSALLRLHCH